MRVCVCVCCARAAPAARASLTHVRHRRRHRRLSLSLVLLRFSLPPPPPSSSLSPISCVPFSSFSFKSRWSSKGRDEKAATLQDVPCCTFENSIASFCLEMSPDILLEESCSCSARRSGACIGEETPQERTQRLAMEDANAYADKQAAVLVLQRRRDQVSVSFSMTRLLFNNPRSMEFHRLYYLLTNFYMLFC